MRLRKRLALFAASVAVVVGPLLAVAAPAGATSYGQTLYNISVQVTSGHCAGYQHVANVAATINQPGTVAFSSSNTARGMDAAYGIPDEVIVSYYCVSGYWWTNTQKSLAVYRYFWNNGETMYV